MAKKKSSGVAASLEAAADSVKSTASDVGKTIKRAARKASKAVEKSTAKAKKVVAKKEGELKKSLSAAAKKARADAEALKKQGIGKKTEAAKKAAEKKAAEKAKKKAVAKKVAAQKKAIKKAVKKYYTISVFDRDEYKSTMSSMINQMLMVLYALLALSIIIAIFGIVNTLALSVSERTKEIGLLRAIGTSRGQVRGMLGIEAAIISVFGTVMGLVVGVSAGVVIRAVYAAKGLETLAIPWQQLLVFLLLSIVVGLVSSISPASRALKQPVLDAVASE